MISEQLRRPVVFVSPDRFATLAGSSELPAQLRHNRFGERNASSRQVTRRVQIASDCPVRMSASFQTEDPRLDRAGRLKFIELADRADDLVLAFETATPANGHTDAFVIADNFRGDLLDQRANDCLSVDG